MRVSELLVRYLPRFGASNATVNHPLGVVDNSSRLLQYDPHFTMFVEAFTSWALNELQKNNHQALSIQPGR